MQLDHWWQADRSQLYLRMFQLESELSVAAVLLELREASAAERGDGRSSVVTELMANWRQLIDAKPAVRDETAEQHDDHDDEQDAS